MTAKKHHSLLTLFLIFSLCINLINVQLVHADDGTPTEPPPPTQVETEPPVEPTSPPIDATPTAETLEETPTPDATPEENTPVTVVPPPTLENTDIVVLDEQGQALPLGSQETADALASSDPVWCPESVSIPTPGANGCSESYASITELLLAMQLNPASFSQNGTIFLEQTTGQGFTTPLILDDSEASLGASFNSLSVFNLTVQGGWHAETGSTSDQTIFNGSSAYVQVGSMTNPWIGSVTLNNLTILNVTSGSNASLAVSSRGAVAMNNVIVIGSGAGQDAIQISASNVALNDVSALYSRANGISIAASEPGTVTLDNVTAENNGQTSGSEATGSGVYIDGADTLINVIGGSFDNNARYGIEASDSTSTTLPVANIWTDQDDYAPGSIVTLGGNDNNLNGETIGFTPGETILVFVQGPNGYTATCEAVADSYGGWNCQITLWDSELAFGAYSYTAVGLTSGVTVTDGFTDAKPNTVSVSTQSPNPVAAGNSAIYTVTVNFNGNNTSCNSPLSITGLPSGASGSFNPPSLTSTGGNVTSTLTITTTSSTPAATTSFTVQASVSGCQSGASPATGQGDLAVVAPSDTTPPVITKTITGTAGANGWYISDVLVDWTVTDAQSSFTVVGCVDTTISADTSGTAVSCSATSTGGTSSDSVTIKRDVTPPSATLTVTAGTPGNNGWYRSDVTVHTSGTDSVSGPATCTADQFQTTETSGTIFNGSCMNNAGLSATASPLTIKLDKTNPIIAFYSITPPNANGWNNTNVVVTWSCSDVLSQPVSDLVSQTVTTEGTGQSATGTCLDNAGNTASATQGGINIDKTPPTLTLPSNITVEATSAAGAAVSYSASVTDNLDASVTVSCSPASSSTFPIGSTTVNCASTDVAGNTANGTFQVTVQDTGAPVIASHADETVEATSAAGATVTYTSPSASDAIDGPVAVTCSPASGTLLPLGNTPVTCNAMDTHGNLAIPVTFTVHVVDTTAPVLTLPGNITVNATGPVGATVTYSASASDTVDPSIPVICNPPSGSAFPVGSTQVNCSASDSSNNTSTGSFFVNVRNPNGPVITVPGNITVEATGPSGATVSYFASATDAVDGSVSVSCTAPSGSIFSLGMTAVHCSATDSDNNTNTASFFITVRDTTAPTISPHSDFTTSTSNPAGVIVNYTSPSTSDAADGAGVASCSPTSGSLFPVGDTEVTCTANDSHGNSSTSTFMIHVKLTQTAPTPTSSGSSSTEASGLIIPLTSGGLFELDCDTVLWLFGIKLSFLNLCDYQAAINSVGALDLPAQLPNGFSFLMGLDVNVVSEGQSLQALPDDSGIETDFPIYDQSRDQFAVLYWNAAENKWIEITQQIAADEIAKTISVSADDELYQLLNTSAPDGSADLFYQILTTDKTGIFVLVKK